MSPAHPVTMATRHLHPRIPRLFEVAAAAAAAAAALSSRKTASDDGSLRTRARAGLALPEAKASFTAHELNETRRHR